MSEKRDIVKRQGANAIGLSSRATALAKIAQTNLTHDKGSPLWNVAHLEMAIESRGFESVLQEALHRAFDHGALTLIEGLLRIGHLLRREESDAGSHFLIHWRDRCFQQGWENAVTQADALLAKRGIPHLRRLHTTVESQKWRFSLEGHTRPLNALLMGKTKIITGAGHDVLIWDAKTGRRLKSLQLGEGPLTAIAMNESEEKLAAGTATGNVCIWNIRSGEVIHHLSLNGCACLHFNADGDSIAIGTWDKNAAIYDADSGLRQWQSKTLSDIPSTLRFNETGSLLAVGLENGGLYAWNRQSEREVAHPPLSDAAITALDFHVDNKSIAVGSNNGDCRLWDLTENRLSDSFTGPSGRIDDIKLTDARILAASSLGVVHSWNLPTEIRNEIWALGGDDGCRMQLAEDGRQWIVGLNDGTAHVWSAKGKDSGERPGAIAVMTVGKGGEMLAVGRKNGLVELWNCIQGQKVAELATDGVEIADLSLSADESKMLVGQINGCVQQWSIPDARLEDEWRVSAKWLSQLKFTPNGILCCTWDGIFEFKDIKGERIESWKGDGSKGECLAISKDGKWMAAGSHGGSLLLWKDQKLISISQPAGDSITALDFSPSANRLYVARKDGFIGAWQDKWLWRRDGLGPVTSVCASLDGKRILSGSADRRMNLWSTSAGGALARFSLPHHPESLAFAPGWRIIAAAGGELHFLQWMRPRKDLR